MKHRGASPGHVFILQGDIRKLACDAWLMPCDFAAIPLPSWTDYPAPLPVGFAWPAPPEGWSRDGVRTMPLTTWPWPGPRPWPTNVGAGHRGIEWYIEGARQFLQTATAALTGQAPLYRRQRHLLALPVIGTRYGGARRRAGEVVQALLPALFEEAERLGVDIALVTFDGPTFAAAQRARSRRAVYWPELDAGLRETAERLAQLARAGELVLFLGAGVSAGAGLPTWGSLLLQLAQEVGMDTREQEALRRLDFLDQARILSRRLGAGRLGPAVAAQLTSHVHSLTQGLLARLPVKEVVTTNYDQLFELASEALGLKVAALPHTPALGCDRWVLKMHGCVAHPEDIVLTREDYMRYAERRAALAGIVQALLITKHMLFVGFSLEDDNFHRIVDAVRKAVRLPGGDAGLFGTTLALGSSPLAEELWGGDLAWACMSDPRSPEELDIPSTARRLEIFLDYLLAHTEPQSAHILDWRYDAVLSEADVALRDALLEFTLQLPSVARRSPAWEQLLEVMRRLGSTDRTVGGAFKGET